MILRLAVVLLLVSGCPTPRSVSVDAGTPDAGLSLDAGVAEAAEDDLPRRDAYAGSAACRDCHAERHEAWSKDWHALALSEPSPKTAAGRYQGQRFKGASSSATMFVRDGGYFMRTADKDAGVSDHLITYLVGGKRMQDSVTEFDDGRWQVLPVYFHVTGGGQWVDYNEAKQGVVGPEHPFYWSNFRRTANHECIACHTTGWTVSYSREDHRWTTNAEPGVGCEACHGPGARHAETKAVGDVLAFSKLPKAQALAICASCHGPREPTFPFLAPGHRYQAGAPYEDSFQPSGLVDGESRSGEYFVDGRPSSSSFEWQALQQSRCFIDGGVTCLTCHGGPHGDTFANELRKSGAKTAALAADVPCAGCHEAEAKDPKAHSHHATVPGQSCVGCHLARTLTGVLDHFADHSIDLPVPENTVAHGVPNACAVCHEKLSAAQLVTQTEAWWPGTARRGRRIRLADAFDEKTKAGSEAPLVQVVRDEAEAPLLRGFAAELLGQRFPQKAAEVLPGLLNAKDAYLRSRVLSGLSAARARGSAAAVAAHLDDPSVVVREFAALLLTSWGDPKGLPAVEKLTTSPATRDLVRPHLVLAQKLASSGQFERARAHTAAALTLMPYSASAIVLEADLAMQQHDADRARASIEEALRFDPSNAGAKKRWAVLQGP